MLSSSQGEALHRREIDVGFLWPPVSSAHAASELLFKQPLVVILPKTHPLSSRKEVKLAVLADETLFLRPRESGKGLHDKVLALYRKAGIRPEVVHTNLSPQFVGSMYVASGNGICILSSKRIMLNQYLAAVRLNEPDATREVHIAWRKGERSPRILRFVDMARSLFEPKVAPEKKTLQAQTALTYTSH